MMSVLQSMPFVSKVQTILLLIVLVCTNVEGRKRIVGGTAASVGEFPFFAFSNTGTLCGATLIYGDILVSAAHCGTKAWSNGIRLGGLFYNRTGSTYYNTTQMIIHPNFKSTNLFNDIMLIKITTFLNRTYVTLNTNTTLPIVNRTIVTAIGHGLTSETGTAASNVLQKVDLSIMPQTLCRSYYSYNNTAQICSRANSTSGGQDACLGDSGGPLFIKGTSTQVGIISGGIGCARPGVPAVNTRITTYNTWIQTTICAISSRPPRNCPTKVPTRRPTLRPTKVPTKVPTKRPTKTPTLRPTNVPTNQPTNLPTATPI